MTARTRALSPNPTINRQIERGAGFDDGTAWTWRECAHCEAARRIYDIGWDGEYNEDSFGAWATEARDLRELRHAAGYRMKWRTRTGALLPIPTADTDPREKEKQ